MSDDRLTLRLAALRVEEAEALLASVRPSNPLVVEPLAVTIADLEHAARRIRNAAKMVRDG